MSGNQGQGRQPQWYWSGSPQNSHYGPRNDPYILPNGQRWQPPRQSDSAYSSDIQSGTSSQFNQDINLASAIRQGTYPRYAPGQGSRQNTGSGASRSTGGSAVPPIDYSRWVTDEVPRYRLTTTIVDGWLRRSFGIHDFHVRAYQDNFVFRVPRRLEEDEIDDILELKVAD